MISVHLILCSYDKHCTLRKIFYREKYFLKYIKKNISIFLKIYNIKYIKYIENVKV